MTEEVKTSAKTSRVDMWKQAAQAELSDNVAIAEGIRKNLVNAKTDVKKRYFTKKFKAVQNDVLRLLTLINSLDAKSKAMMEQATPEVAQAVDQAA